MKAICMTLLLATTVAIASTTFAGAIEPIDGRTTITEHHWGGGWHRGGRGGRGGDWNGGGRGGCW